MLEIKLENGEGKYCKNFLNYEHISSYNKTSFDKMVISIELPPLPNGCTWIKNVGSEIINMLSIKINNNKIFFTPFPI